MTERTLPPLSELLPHGPPMRLIDRVIARTPDGIVCDATVSASGVFTESGEVPAAICLEYIAQACAAFVGLDARARAEPVRPGYLLACRSLDLSVDTLRVGDRVEVRVTRTSSAAAASSFSGEVVRRGTTIARGKVSVVLDGEAEADESSA